MKVVIHFFGMVVAYSFSMKGVVVFPLHSTDAIVSSECVRYHIVIIAILEKFFVSSEKIQTS
jgi:hypothetical protein